MTYLLQYNPPKNNPEIIIPGSKSESNRLLILKAIYPAITIENLSNSDDTLSLEKGIKETNGTVDVHHAGTAMRFLTAYFASKKGVEITLTGSKRMQERPIEILVDALLELGADISYLKEVGFPPIRIIGKKLTNNKVSLNANISSQYISALMLIAPSLQNGLHINLVGEITSSPYIKMTLKLLQKIGVNGIFENNKIEIKPLKNSQPSTICVESDWSSASYFYSIVALSEKMKIKLSNYSKESLQGDSEVVSIYKELGVDTIFNKKDNSIEIVKNKKVLPSTIYFNLNKTPDIAQTIAVTCLGLRINCKLEGLKTLKIKETDRLVALKTEIEKLGAKVLITNSSIAVFSSEKINKNIVIDTYQDHRMAMAFAPLALVSPVAINNPEVVSKSYATFWKDLEKTGIFNQIK